MSRFQIYLVILCVLICSKPNLFLNYTEFSNFKGLTLRTPQCLNAKLVHNSLAFQSC